jgi:hypothetical protein
MWKRRKSNLTGKARKDVGGMIDRHSFDEGHYQTQLTVGRNLMANIFLLYPRITFRNDVVAI